MSGAGEGRCESVTLMLDDRFGAIREQCELSEGHKGEHSVAMTACMPLAHLRWPDA
jgi:hypothetical protein